VAETPTAGTASLEGLEAELLGAIATADDVSSLEEVRVAALGKKGRISELMQTLARMAPEERKSFGQAVNQLKDRVSGALEEKREALSRAALSARLAQERADVTLPVREGPLAEGRIHPVSQVADEITEIFADLGFSIAEGPDIETDFNNFTALNIPPEHPARQDHDTFYFAEGADGRRPVLRTHTSPVQVRTMLKEKPPLRIIAPGRVYRSDSDQTHTPMFHQVEGLAIDEETHLGHLKWVLEEFCKAFFEVPKVKMRFRASHFPFTEPSMEVDIGYAKVGEEIRIGEGDQWLEILGCGMVHPNVLKNVGLDPNRYQGFAFGLGIDRIAMLKYGMPDLRAFFAADLRWLKHYGFPSYAVPTLAGGLGQPL
jgi:phenylalanyl-tRNA synthetase alpha chain